MLLIAFFAAFLISALLVYLTIRFCTKHDIYDEVDPRKIHSGNIPRLGGLGLFLSATLVSLAYTILFQKSTVFFSAYHTLFSAAWIFIFGLCDDIRNLRAKFKFVCQIVAAAVVSMGPFYIHQFLGFEIPVVLGRILTAGWILACVNAFNLIDGIDWLCSGIVFFTMLALGTIQYFFGGEIFSIYFIIAGATAGFMFWNRPPAKIFLGDAGSQTLGFIIATLPLISNTNPTIEYTKIISLVLLASIPITDTIAAIWRRTREHRKWFSPDRAHIHHKLLNVGFSKPAAIFFLLFLQFLICAVVVGASFLSPRSATVVLLVALVFVELIFITFHYLNRAVNLKHKGHLEDCPQEER